MLPLGKGVRVLKQDANGLIALYKPAGILSHPNSGGTKPGECLVSAPYDMGTETFRITASSTSATASSLWLLHRLDSATSGVILVSTNAAVAKAVKQQIKRRAVTKHYTALVFCKPIANGKETQAFRPMTWVDGIGFTKKNGVLRALLSTEPSCPIAETVASAVEVQSRPYSSAQNRPSYSLLQLDLQPITGYTHQLRFQAHIRNLPIVGDCTYGNFAANKEFKANMSRHPFNDSAVPAESAGQFDAANSAADVRERQPARNYFKGLFLHARRIDLMYTLGGVSYSFSAEAPLPAVFDIAMRSK
jgi:tRNA pseudouridine65 synthase